jgi:hypothetical protein
MVSSGIVECSAENLLFLAQWNFLLCKNNGILVLPLLVVCTAISPNLHTMEDQ